MLDLHENVRGVSLTVKVQPRARRTAIIGEAGGVLRIALTAPPVEGRANQACIDFLAELMGLPKSAVTIISGEHGRKKVVRLAGISASVVRDKLGC